MVKIIAPNKNFDGETAGVKFSDGVGRTDNEYLIKWFKSKGYKVVEEASEPKKEEPKPGPREEAPKEEKPKKEEPKKAKK